MKRKDILKKLAEAGFTVQEGGNHTRVYDKNKVTKSTRIIRRKAMKSAWTLPGISMRCSTRWH